MKKTIIILITLLLAACGSETFEGDYVTKTSGDNPFSGMTQQRLSFRKDGKVRVFMMGNQVGVFKYEKDGDEITLFKGDGTSQILTIEKNGSLFGGGVELAKVKDKNVE